MSTDLGPYLHEWVMDTQKLHDHADEAAKLYAAGDIQGACDVVAIAHYPLGQVSDERANLLTELKKQGFAPGG